MKFLSGMKRVGLCALVVAAVGQTLSARDSHPTNASGEIFATSPADGGRLVIRRSPSLGHDVSMSIYIDGKPAGTLVRAHTYDRYITPGTHILSASPDSALARWQGTLNVRVGETNTYTASVSVDKLVLTPASALR